MILFLGILLGITFNVQAEPMVEVENAMSTESTFIVSGADYYIINTADVSTSSGFTYETTLTLVMGGCLSVKDILSLIDGAGYKQELYKVYNQ